jgi:hypothetical protein
MRPMLAAGGLAALLIAIVVPVAMNGFSGGSGAKVEPTPAPIEDSQIQGYYGNGNQQGAANAGLATPTAIAKSTAVAKPTAVSVQKLVLKDDGAKPTPLVLKDVSKQVDPAVNSALAKNPNDRAMSNFVNAIEDQASTVSEGTPMIASCDPTIVYVNPTATSDPITKVPRGSTVSMLKQVKGFAALAGGLGIGAGLPSIFSEAPPKISPDEQKKIEELKKADAAKQVLWYYVQLEGNTRGWILASCTTQMAQPIAEPPSSSQSLRPQGKSKAPPPDLFGEKNAVQNSSTGDDDSSAQQAPNQAPNPAQGQYVAPPTPTPTPATYSKKSKK